MSNFNHDRNEITSNNDNNSQDQKCKFNFLIKHYSFIIALFTFFSNIKKKFKQVFVDLSDEENENNIQAKSDSFSVSNNLPYLYDAPSLNQNNDYKFYDSASFGNSNRNRNNLSNQAKQVSNFTDERKNSDSEAICNPNLSLKEREYNVNIKRAHPLVKIVNTILSSKYNLGPIEKETLPEKTSVFSYNSAFKPIINKAFEESNPDLILNSSYEKLSSLKKRNFLLNPSFMTHSTSKSNYNLFRLDNSILKPKVVRLWENNHTHVGEGEKRLLSKKRSRYENDDFARFSPEFEENFSWKNRNFDLFNSSIRNSRQMKFVRDYEIEEKRKAYNDFRALDESKLTLSNVNLSGLKLNQLQQFSNQNKLSKHEKDLMANSKSNVNSFLNEDKNSLYSNQNLQDKNNIYFNKPIQPHNKNFKGEINLNNNNNNEINLSTIDNLNSSISSRQNNLDFYGNKGLKDKSLEEIRAELNEKKKANQKLLNEINFKTKRSFRGENFEEDEFSHANLYNKKLLGNKNYLRNFHNEEEEIINYRNKNGDGFHNNDDLVDERKRKIADFYRNKDLMNKKDLDLISGSNAEYIVKKNKLNLFDGNSNKHYEDKVDAGKTFSFKNIKKRNNKEKRSDDEDKFINYNKEKSQITYFNKQANLIESDKDSASFGADESLKEKSGKSFASQKSNKKTEKKFKEEEEENKNTDLLGPAKKEDQKTLFGFNFNNNKNNENENANKTNVFNLFGTSSNNNDNKNLNQQKDFSNIFGNKANNEAEKEKEKQENINEIKKPSLFESKDEKEKASLNLISNTTTAGENKPKDSLPMNNNLFGGSLENKPSSDLFGLSNQEKPKADESTGNTNNSAFPIFNQMAKKSESEKPAESKSLFGNLASSSILFSAANALKPNSTPLFVDKKLEDKEYKNEENKAEAKIDNLNNMNNNINKSLFSFGASNTANNNINNISNSLFGASAPIFAGTKPESTNNKSLFGLTVQNEEKTDKEAEQKQEGATPKFAAESTKKDENKALAPSIAPQPVEKDEPAAAAEKKENENEFSLFKNEDKETGASFGFKPSISVSAVFNQGPSIPSLFANANKAPIFGKPTETLKIEEPKVEKEKEKDKETLDKPDENASKSTATPNPTPTPTPSLFGNSINSAPSLFGKDDKNKLSAVGTEAPKPAAATSLFGNASGSLFSKPATESSTSTSLFSLKPAEQSNNNNASATSAGAQTAKNSFCLFNPKSQTNEPLNPPSSTLFSTPSTTGLFGTSAPQESKQIEQQKTQTSSSLFGNLHAKAPEQTITPAADSNKASSSLFGSGNNLINNTKNNLTMKADSTFNMFAPKINNESTMNSNTQSSLFQGLNVQAQNQTNNVFMPQPVLSKPSSIFSTVNNDKSGVSSGLSFGVSNDISAKIEPVGNVNNTISNAGGEQQQQNKSLLNDKNPFLQKTNVSQNNLFTSSNSNQNTFSAQNNNTNSNMNQQPNAFFISSDKRNNGNRLDVGPSTINNFGSNLFSNENKSNVNPNPSFPVNTNSLFGQQNTNNGIFSNSSSLFGSNNNAMNNNNMGSSLFGNNNPFSGNNNLLNNNINNNLNGGNEDMSISPVRSPNLQPKLNNTNMNNLHSVAMQQNPQNNSLFGNSGSLFNQSNTNNNAMNGGSGLFGNPNQNQGGLFNNSAANTQSGTGLFSNVPNFMNNNNNNSLFGAGAGFSIGKK